jgi:uncharacterized protein DUF3108
MKSTSRWSRVWLALPLCFAASAMAAPLPPKVTLYFDIRMAGVSLAEGVETLEQDGKTYRITSDAKGKGIVAALYKGALSRSVRGAIVRQGLRPLEYHDRRGDREPTGATFDWDRKTVMLSHDGKTETQALPPDASDRLSYFYQFAFVPLPQHDMEFSAFDGRGKTHFHFLPGAGEKLDTPLGQLDTVKLTKQREGPDDKETEVWLAPSLHNLPVRVVITDKDGMRADQMISRIEQ